MEKAAFKTVFEDWIGFQQTELHIMGMPKMDWSVHIWKGVDFWEKAKESVAAAAAVASVVSDSVRPHRRQPTKLPHPWDSLGKNTEVGCHFLLQCMKVKSQSKVVQSCLTLSDPMDCRLGNLKNFRLLRIANVPDFLLGKKKKKKKRKPVCWGRDAAGRRQTHTRVMMPNRSPSCTRLCRLLRGLEHPTMLILLCGQWKQHQEKHRNRKCTLYLEKCRSQVMMGKWWEMSPRKWSEARPWRVCIHAVGWDFIL